MWSKRVHLFLGKYSSKHNAVPTPKGIAKNAVQNITQRLPQIADLIPAREGCLDGKFERKSRLREDQPSMKIPAKITHRKKIESQTAREQDTFKIMFFWDLFITGPFGP